MNVAQYQVEIARRDKHITELEEIITNLRSPSDVPADPENPDIVTSQLNENPIDEIITYLENLVDNEGEELTQIAGALSMIFLQGTVAGHDVQTGIKVASPMHASAPMNVDFWVKLASTILGIIVEFLKNRKTDVPS